MLTGYLLNIGQEIYKSVKDFQRYTNLVYSGNNGITFPMGENNLERVCLMARKDKSCKGGGRLRKTNPNIICGGRKIPRVDETDKRPLTQRIMCALGCNRKHAQRIIKSQQ